MQRDIINSTLKSDQNNSKPEQHNAHKSSTIKLHNYYLNERILRSHSIKSGNI